MTVSCRQVHVWRASLEVSTARRAQLERTLSPDERERASRFRRALDRERFLVGRGVLRDIVSRYLGQSPSQVRLRCDAYGKPFLAPNDAPVRLDFNLSHSMNLAVYAISGGSSVGIDVERIQPEIDCDRLAAQFFSPCEHRALQALHRGVRSEAFFACWTRKEAYLKARGLGLSVPLDHFDVSVGPGAPAQVLAARGELITDTPWWIQECVPASGYLAAVAGSGPSARLAYWQWSG
jgi:4'-phosphopantetheinyl transferase